MTEQLFHVHVIARNVVHTSTVENNFVILQSAVTKVGCATTCAEHLTLTIIALEFFILGNKGATFSSECVTK